MNNFVKLKVEGFDVKIIDSKASVMVENVMDIKMRDVRSTVELLQVQLGGVEKLELGHATCSYPRNEILGVLVNAENWTISKLTLTTPKHNVTLSLKEMRGKRLEEMELGVVQCSTDARMEKFVSLVTPARAWRAAAVWVGPGCHQALAMLARQVTKGAIDTIRVAMEAARSTNEEHIRALWAATKLAWEDKQGRVIANKEDSEAGLQKLLSLREM